MTAKQIEEEAAKPANECKILEVQLNKNIKCEIVGSDKIDDLSKIISENKNDRIIFIAPDSQIRDLSNMTSKYLSSASPVDLNSHFDSDIFKNLDFTYRGMRCSIAEKDVVIWSGKKSMILTIE